MAAIYVVKKETRTGEPLRTVGQPNKCEAVQRITPSTPWLKEPSGQGAQKPGTHLLQRAETPPTPSTFGELFSMT